MDLNLTMILYLLHSILSDAAQANLESPEFVIEESSGDARFATGQ